MTSQHYLHTGQRTCHADACEGSGQDASFAVGPPWPEPPFDLRDDAVMDGLTGLTWCRNANLAEFPLTWEALVDCAAHSPALPSGTSFRRRAGYLLVVNHQPVRARLGLGPCTRKKARRGSDKSASHNFRYGLWPVTIES